MERLQMRNIREPEKRFMAANFSLGEINGEVTNE